MKHQHGLALLPFLTFSSAASAQGLERNPLRLHNGVEVVYIVDWAPSGQDYAWKVFPRETLRHPSGFLHLSGFEFHVYDSDPATPSAPFQVQLTKAIPSQTFPGAFEPDFSNPIATLALAGGIKVPGSSCLNSEAEIALRLSTSIPIPADGSTDYALVITQPICGPAIGPCGFPDCTYISVYSTDEGAADELGGKSPYGGLKVGPVKWFDFSTDSLAAGLYFEEPMLAIRTGPASGGTPVDLGLAGLNLPLAQGAQLFAYTVRAQAPAGSIALAASTLSSLPGAGLPLLGTGLLLDPADPVLAATLSAGGFGAPSSSPSTSLLFESQATFALNSSAIGLSFHSQAFVLQATAGLARSSNLVRTDLLP